MEKPAEGENGESHNLELSFGMSSAGQDDQGDESIIDIRGLLGQLISKIEVKPVGAGKYVISGYTSQGSHAVVCFEPGREEGACTRLELYTKGTSEPFLVLDEIILNLGLSDDDLRFPREKILQSGLRTHELNSESFLDTMQLMQYLMRAMVVRMVLAGSEDPTLVKSIETAYGRKPDWKKLREKDAAAGDVLRKILPAMADDSKVEK